MNLWTTTKTRTPPSTPRMPAKARKSRSKSPLLVVRDLFPVLRAFSSDITRILGHNLSPYCVISRGHYAGIHASGFRDFILKPQCMQAIQDCGFEHPSEGTAFANPQLLRSIRMNSCLLTTYGTSTAPSPLPSLTLLPPLQNCSAK